MQFKIYENAPVELKILLEKAGHVAKTVFDQSLCGRSDTRIMNVCRDESLVLVSLDSDFSNIQAYPPGTHPGIMVLRPRSQGAKVVTNIFEDFLNKVDVSQIRAATMIVEKERIRIRRQEQR